MGLILDAVETNASECWSEIIKTFLELRFLQHEQGAVMNPSIHSLHTVFLVRITGREGLLLR